MTYAKRTPVEQRVTLVGQWERSGLTMREFCRQRGINESSLGWWRREIARKAAPSASKLELIEIAAHSSPVDRAVEVVLPNGICVRVPVGVERRWFEEVLAVVRAC